MSERKRRIEAARAYAGIKSQNELGDRLGFKRPKFVRYLNGNGIFRPGDLLAIADECDVPLWFLEHGFDGWVEELKKLTPADLEALADELFPDDPPST